MQKINLNFGKFIFINIKKEAEDQFALIKYFNTLFTNLPKYTKGTVKKPTSGYTNLKINTKGKFLTSHEGKIQELLICKRYIKEKYGEITITDIDGVEKIVNYPKHQITDIFWLFPDMMAIMGSKNDTDGSFETLKELLGKDVEMELIEFEHDFFMWLQCCLLLNKGVIDNNFEILKIEEDETEHTALRTNRSGVQSIIRGSDDAILSPQTLNSLANGHDIFSIRANFELDDSLDKFKTSARLTRLDGIHIFSRFVKFTGEEWSKYLFSLIFLRKVFETYLDWKKLPEEEKKPNKECYQKMLNEMEGQSIDGVQYFREIVDRFD